MTKGKEEGASSDCVKDAAHKERKALVGFRRTKALLECWDKRHAPTEGGARSMIDGIWFICSLCVSWTDTAEPAAQSLPVMRCGCQ